MEAHASWVEKELRRVYEHFLHLVVVAPGLQNLSPTDCLQTYNFLNMVLVLCSPKHSNALSSSLGFLGVLLQLFPIGPVALRGKLHPGYPRGPMPQDLAPAEGANQNMWMFKWTPCRRLSRGMIDFGIFGPFLTWWKKKKKKKKKKTNRMATVAKMAGGWPPYQSSWNPDPAIHVICTSSVKGCWSHAWQNGWSSFPWSCCYFDAVFFLPCYMKLWVRLEPSNLDSAEHSDLQIPRCWWFSSWFLLAATKKIEKCFQPRKPYGKLRVDTSLSFFCKLQKFEPSAFNTTFGPSHTPHFRSSTSEWTGNDRQAMGLHGCKQ